MRKGYALTSLSRVPIVGARADNLVLALSRHTVYPTLYPDRAEPACRYFLTLCPQFFSEA